VPASNQKRRLPGLLSGTPRRLAGSRIGIVWYASFLLRLWSESSVSASVPAPDWHAEIEQIQSGERWTFGNLDELLEFLRQQADRLAQPAGKFG
jgi:hypothetical protein